MTSKVILTKLSGTHPDGVLVGHDVEGVTRELPTEQTRFRLIGVLLNNPDPNTVRMITTSIIQKVYGRDGDTIAFDTEFSKYQLQILEENIEEY